MHSIYPVVMSGGTGTRLWPLSRKSNPKQYRALVTSRTMIEETALRLEGIEGAEVRPPMIVCGQNHCTLVQDLFAGASLPLGPIVLEPMGRNTAPVAVIASLLVAAEDPDGMVLLLPADHHIADAPAFAAAVSAALPAAAEGRLVTFGIAPDRPETGYGYIRRGEEIAPQVHAVDAFVEKPDLATAKQYLADDRYAWNAGIFLFRADSLLREAEIHAPEIHSAAKAALEASPPDGTVITLEREAFGAVPSDSIDYAIMEKTDRAAVVGPVTMGWNDIGSWHSVRALSQTEAHASNGAEIVSIQCDDTHISADGITVAAIGLSNVVIVATRDAVLVVDADRAQDVKQVIDELKARGREDLL